MQNNLNDSTEEKQETPAPRAGVFSYWMQAMIRLGLGESLMQIATNVLSIVAIATVVWLARGFNDQATGSAFAAQSDAPTPTPAAQMAPLPQAEIPVLEGIGRNAQIHTIIPSRPRTDIVKYTVQQGDTAIGIAEKFGLQPETIFWGNPYTLQDDPHNLMLGQELNILPVDGVYREWQAGEGLNGVAKFYGVKPEDIINFPANHLDMATIGDFGHPNIKPGTWIIVPGGTRGPIFEGATRNIYISRENPATAHVLGPGWCEPVVGGAVGSGVFAWPASRHYLSGFDYTEKGHHWGIDIAGNLGEGAYAADSGVVVYAGWNNYGYGNMIVVDHGGGFQSLYAHLSDIYVGCGQNVLQGKAIGAIGSTGRSSGAHLHFEIRVVTSDSYHPVNPWNLLPPP